MKTTSFIPRFLLLAAGCSLQAITSASAADGTWNVDASGLWSTAGNWTPGVADGSGFTANFTNDITADRTVSLDGDRTLTNVVFGDSDTATAGSWILNNNGVGTNNLILAGTTPTITVNALGTSRTATISAIIQGTAGLAKAGTGTLILSGVNTYTGTTLVNAGTLQLGAAGVLADTSNLIINSGATLNMGGFAETIGTLTLNRGTITGFGGTDTVPLGTGSGGFITTGGTVANWPGIRLGGNFQYNTDGGNETTANIGAFNFGGAGRTFTVADGVQAIDVQINVSLYDSSAGSRNLIKAGAGTLRIGGPSFDNYNLGTGATTIQDGVLELGKADNKNAVGGTGLVTVGDGTGAASSAVLRYVNGNDQIPGNAITVNSDGLLDIANKTDAVGAVTLAGGSITGTTGVLTGTSYAVQSGSVSGRLGGSGALTKTTAGTVTLSGANTYTGHTTVSDGTLKVTGAGRLYSAAYNGTAVVTVQSGGVLELDTWSYGTSQSLGQLAREAARIVINNGTIRMNGTTEYGRGVTVQSGGATFEAAAGANWVHGGPFDFTANVYTGNPSLTFTGAGNGTFEKIFSGGGTLTKGGSGTWTLSGVNTHTGNTTVSDGTLQIGAAGKLYGVSTGVPTATVASGTTLRVNGWNWDQAGGLGQLWHDAPRLVVNGGTIEYAGSSNGGTSADRNFTIGTGGATLKTTTAGQTWTLTPGTFGALNIDNGLTVGGAGNGAISKLISGTGALTKTDGGTWTLSGANSYTGATTINAGTLKVASLAAGGSNSAIGAAAVAAGNLVINGGTLQYDANTAAQSTNRLFTLGTGGATFDSSSASSANTMSFTATGAVGTTGSGARLLTLTGGNTGNNTMAPVIGDGPGGTTSLTKSGAGKWVLSGANSFTGIVSVTGGTLAISSGNEASLGANPPGFNAGQLTLNGGTLQVTSASLSINDSNRGLTIGSSGGTFNVDTGLTLSVSTPLNASAAGELTKAGQGALNYSYTGSTPVNVLRVTGGGTYVQSAGTTTIQTGGVAQGLRVDDGEYKLEAGTLRTDRITVASGELFTWGVNNGGGYATLTMKQERAAVVGTGIDRTGSTGADSGPVVLEGTRITVDGQLATTNRSILDLGPLYNSGALLYDNIQISGTLSLAAGSTLNFEVNPYFLRPSSPNAVTEGDWGTLVLVRAQSITGAFDNITGIGSDAIGWTQHTGAFTSAKDLPINTWYVQTLASFDDEPGVSATSAVVLFHYRVSGSVPEPASAGLMISGMLILRSLRRRSTQA